nr:unnamed protein product [Callosobruchus chinensis]
MQDKSLFLMTRNTWSINFLKTMMIVIFYDTKVSGLGGQQMTLQSQTSEC